MQARKVAQVSCENPACLTGGDIYVFATCGAIRIHKTPYAMLVEDRRSGQHLHLPSEDVMRLITGDAGRHRPPARRGRWPW
jgi:hypothetical protein